MFVLHTNDKTTDETERNRSRQAEEAAVTGSRRHHLCVYLTGKKKRDRWMWRKWPCLLAIRTVSRNDEGEMKEVR